MKTLLWGSLLCIGAAIIYTFRKELGLDKDDSSSTKVSSSLAFSAQANALLVDEINKYKSKLSELEGQRMISVVEQLPTNMGNDEQFYLVKNENGSQLYFFDGQAINEFLLI